MKVALLALFFAASASAFAQNSASLPTAACGSGNVSYKVKLDDSRHAPALPASASSSRRPQREPLSSFPLLF